MQQQSIFYSLVTPSLPLLITSLSLNAGLSVPMSKSGFSFFSMLKVCRRTYRSRWRFSLRIVTLYQSAWVLSLAQVETRCLISHPGSFEQIKFQFPLHSGFFFYLWCLAPAEADQVTLSHKQVRVEAFLLASPLKKKEKKKWRAFWVLFWVINFKVPLHCGRRAYLWSCSPAGQTRSWSPYPEGTGRRRTESTRSLPAEACHWCTNNIVCTTTVSSLIMYACFVYLLKSHSSFSQYDLLSGLYFIKRLTDQSREPEWSTEPPWSCCCCSSPCWEAEVGSYRRMVGKSGPRSPPTESTLDRQSFPWVHPAKQTRPQSNTFWMRQGCFTSDVTGRVM